MDSSSEDIQGQPGQKSGNESSPVTSNLGSGKRKKLHDQPDVHRPVGIKRQGDMAINQDNWRMMREEAWRVSVAIDSLRQQGAANFEKMMELKLCEQMPAGTERDN